MIYRIVHKTTYKYKHPVAFGNHAVHLMPRTHGLQRCESYELLVTPTTSMRSDRTDYFGNCLNSFAVQQPHEELVVEARSTVSMTDTATPGRSMAWDDVAKTIETQLSAANLEASQFLFESPRIRPSVEFASYAMASFPRGRPLSEALSDFTARIHRDFRFDSKATNVRTSPEEVLLKRKGVCQDFAHLQIACLRSMNIPARYVSGYLRTFPPPGQPRLVGADASHAWVSVYCPASGWLDFDPTNNLVPSQSHVTVAWGRDYGDVSPVRGVIRGGRDHSVEVAVDMEPFGS